MCMHLSKVCDDLHARTPPCHAWQLGKSLDVEKKGHQLGPVLQILFLTYRSFSTGSSLYKWLFCICATERSFTCRYFPDEKDTTAHLPLQAHFLAPESPPPPSMARNSSSCPGFRPTTTSALQVRRANTLSPDPGPNGPMASVNGVAASHCACRQNVSS